MHEEIEACATALVKAQKLEHGISAQRSGISICIRDAYGHTGELERMATQTFISSERASWVNMNVLAVVKIGVKMQGLVSQRRDEGRLVLERV